MIDKDGNYLWSTIYDNAVRCPDRVIVKRYRSRLDMENVVLCRLEICSCYR